MVNSIVSIAFNDDDCVCLFNSKENVVKICVCVFFLKFFLSLLCTKRNETIAFQLHINRILECVITIKNNNIYLENVFQNVMRCNCRMNAK